MIAITDNGTTALLGLALDAAVMRHRAIAHNIANANTAGYRPLGVSFESRLGAVKDALARGTGATSASVAAAQPAVETASAAQTIRIDAEVARLSENTLHHQALLKMLNRHFSIVSAAIGEGKR